MEGEPNAAVTRTNYIFVDFENVPEVDLDLIQDKPAKVVLVIGKQTTKLPIKLAKQLLTYAPQLEMIEAACSGKNALDFVLAYLIGRRATQDPEGFFHVVSGDKGFDALILHLRANKVQARREKTFAGALNLPNFNTSAAAKRLPNAKAPAPTPASIDRVALIKKRLTANQKSRPRRKKTLLSQINAYFDKRLAPKELEAICQALIDDGTITLTPTNAVTYDIS